MAMGMKKRWSQYGSNRRDKLGDEEIGNKVGDNRRRLTSMCRSVALVNESITRGRTVESGRCLGKDVPDAGVWFLK